MQLIFIYTYINLLLEDISPPDYLKEFDIMIEEVEKAVKKLKTNNSVGIDDVPGELLKHDGKAIIACLHKTGDQVWKKGTGANSMDTIHPQHHPSKSDLQTCDNYRTILLIPHSSKVLLTILLDRMHEQMEPSKLASEPEEAQFSRSLDCVS